jgi:Dolichyl-phosphate-mannose-protein mannosyltransferase
MAVGWNAGYRDPAAYLAFWGVAVMAMAAAGRVVVRGWPSDGPTDTVLRTGLVSIAIAIACAGVLGALHRLTLAWLLLLHGIAAAAALAVGSRRDARTFALDSLPTALVAIVAAFLAFALAFGATHAPFTLYDSVSYHLFFAARWVQDHAISIVPTPFSDEAQAYAPANGEAFFAWLMLPFHGDLLARIGQLPFALLGAIALYAIARRLGAPPDRSAYPPAFFLFSRPVAEQMVGANVDLICASLFALSLWLAIVAVDRGDRRDWALLGVALGLYWGSKYVALVYTPVLLLIACARGVRARMLWSLPGIAAFALPWYARNWALAGSPIYPASLAIGGVTVARGAFNRAAMLNTIFHTTDLRLLPAMAAHAFGPTLFVVWLPCAIAGWIAMSRRGWWPAGVLVLVPLAMVPLYWFGFPVNVDSRFLLPAIGPALLPLAFVFPRSRRASVFVHTVLTLALVWIAVGVRAQLPGAVPWFMGGWLALDGLVTPAFLTPMGVLAATLAAVWVGTRRSARFAVPAVTGAIAAAAVVLTVGATRWCTPDACVYLDTTSPYIRVGYADSWRWISQNVFGSTVAYTGINLPYPLTGQRLTNRVVYANIDGRTQWRFHDYDRAYRAGRFEPLPPVLARSSGELLPVADRSGPRDDAVRPRYERMHGVRDAWIFNLEKLHVGYLFVATLSAYEIDYVWHNDRRFPIEDDWAQADPTRFHLVYTNPEVHIYAFESVKRART